MNELNYIIKDVLDDLKKVLDNAGIYYSLKSATIIQYTIKGRFMSR